MLYIIRPASQVSEPELTVSRRSLNKVNYPDFEFPGSDMNLKLLTIFVSLVVGGCAHEETTETAESPPRQFNSPLDEILDLASRKDPPKDAPGLFGKSDSKNRKKPPPNKEERQKLLNQQKLEKEHALFAEVAARQKKIPWPPRLGAAFPDMPLIDSRGKIVEFSSFRGKVVLVEYGAMNSATTQAFSGAREFGPFGSVSPSPRLNSIRDYFADYAAGTDPRRVTFVQILFADLENRIPLVDDLAAWAEHFGDARSGRTTYFSAGPLLRKRSDDLVPGFQLLDRNLVVRADATGSSPRQDLFKDLLPMIPSLLKDRAK